MPIELLIRLCLCFCFFCFFCVFFSLHIVLYISKRTHIVLGQLFLVDWRLGERLNFPAKQMFLAQLSPTSKVIGGDHKLIIRHMITFIKKPKNKLPYFLNIDISKHNLHWIRFLSFLSNCASFLALDVYFSHNIIYNL